MMGPVQISASQLSVVQPQVYEGRGSSKALHRVVDSTGRFGLYKEYKDDVVAELDAEALINLVTWPSTLDPQQRERLLPHLAHPFAIVTAARGRVAGVVMPEAPGHFFYRDRRGKVRPRTIDTLSTPRRMARTNHSLFFEPPHRLALLGRLLLLICELHDSGVVVGDLQPQNILVTGDPMAPAVMLLDCDSFWLQGRHAFGEPTDPETWRSPWMEKAFTGQTDLFKLALLVTRCMQEDNRDWYPKRDVLAQYMPAHQVDRLEALLAQDAAVSAQQLRSLAGNWRTRVGSNGAMYNSTDTYLHAPWTPPLAEQEEPPWGSRPMPPQGQAPAAPPMPQPFPSPQPPLPPPIAPPIAAIADSLFARPAHRTRRAALGWVLVALLVAGALISALNGNGG
jgi:hypothetical protein